MNGWLVALLLLAVYVTFIVWLIQTGRLKKWNLSLMLGIVLMIRTQRGKRLLDILARPKRLWNAFGDFGIVITLTGMVLMTALFLLSVVVTLQPDSEAPALGASEILVIPGVNPFVPLWYGLLALILTLVVHEGGHGVLARANGMKVKSLGLLVAVVPIGAFVEPDDEDLRRSSRRKRLRVFAAGPLLNFLFAGLFLGAFVGGLAATDPAPGAWYNLAKDGPADEAGMPAIGAVVALDGVTVANWAEFSGHMRNRTAGDVVAVTLEGGRTYDVTTANRWDALPSEAQQEIFSNNTIGIAYCRAVVDTEVESGPECAQVLQGKPLLGVNQVPQAEIAAIKRPFGIDCGGGGLRRVGCEMFGMALLAYLPIGEVRDQPFLSVYLPEFHAAPFEAAIFWPLVILCFWMFWINLMVGLTNILPMLPLDGGHIFRDAVGGVVAKAAPNAQEETRERIVNRTALITSLVILGAFILMIVGPRFV